MLLVILLFILHIKVTSIINVIVHSPRYKVIVVDMDAKLAQYTGNVSSDQFACYSILTLVTR
jgi:hypothetical protein